METTTDSPHTEFAAFADVEVAGGTARATLPPLSLAAMTRQLA